MRESLATAMTSHRCRFGLFEFDASSKELRREGVLVRLQSQPAQVLACLTERAGTVVSREDLHQAVWHNDTFVDFERGLNFCIAQIRDALADDAASPRFIRTIPKRGYQFIAPVERIGDSGSLPAAPVAAMENAFSRWLGMRNIVIATTALALVFMVGYWFKSRATTQPDPIVAVVRFDNETGDPSATRFSDALTDRLVADLTAAGTGKYRVIGNAQILRIPREQRDLRAIASSLSASYVILGQVQLQAGQIRVLAHLIHLPEQTHILVTRSEQGSSDDATFESQIAQKVMLRFAPLIAARVTTRSSQIAQSH